MPRLRVAAAQLNTIVGDIEGNILQITDALALAESSKASVCVFPELTITGYPPEDLLMKPGFVTDNTKALQRVAALTKECVAVVGFVEPIGESSDLANSAAICVGGEVVGIYRKQLLPNYGVFDEQRWFVPGDDQVDLFRVDGVLVGITICEDIWFDNGPAARQARAGAGLLLNINASPYSRGRRKDRLEMLQKRAAETSCPIVYVNQVGGQDELVFDGASLVVAADGSLLASGLQFASDLILIDILVDSNVGEDTHTSKDSRRRERDLSAGVSPTSPRPLESAPNIREVRPARSVEMTPIAPPPLRPALPEYAEIYEALVLGTRDYIVKNGFSDVVIGLSGGIDSSLVAAIATDALGPSRVHGVSMPSRYSSDGSRIDAGKLAVQLGIDLHVAPIEEAHTVMSNLLSHVLGHDPQGLTDENLQSRLRGITLMGLSNAKGWIVLVTGNKSEMATGYFTLCGDSAGGFAVIKDVPKTLVYDLCRYRNRKAEIEGREPIIPLAVLEKPPSAELRLDQRDDQSLPRYEELDPILEAYVEHDFTFSELIAKGFDPDLSLRIIGLVDGAEYKRRQVPLGVRITTKAFGKDRRMPITNYYRS